MKPIVAGIPNKEINAIDRIIDWNLNLIPTPLYFSILKELISLDIESTLKKAVKLVIWISEKAIF